MLLAMYRAYERALAKYPFLTQTSSAGQSTSANIAVVSCYLFDNCLGALAALADMLTQSFVENRWQTGNYDPAPITYRWFLLLEKLKGKANSLPLKRMILDQSIAAPLFTFSFITNLHVLEGNSPGDALEKAKNEIVPVMKTNYKVWPLAQLINFYLLPLRYRLIFVQFMGLFWNMYMSYATQIEHKQISEPEEYSPKDLHG